MNKKRGQVTIFIIVGVILVAFAGFMIFLFSGVETESDATEIYADEINTLVLDCIEEIVENRLFFISLQGGYSEANPPRIEEAFFNIPFYFINGTYIQSPTLGGVESGLSDYIESQIINCVNDFSIFENF